MIPLRYVVLPVLAIAGLALAAYTVKKQNQPVPPPAVPIQPNASPYVARIAGVGSVEPSTEVVKVGAPLGGLVENVAVVEGQTVKRGDVLFVLDRREATARLATAEADLRVAQAKLASLDAKPWPEDVARAEARLNARVAALEDARGRLKRLDSVGSDAVVTANERPTLEFQVHLLESQVGEAKADLEQVRRGTYPEQRDEAVAAISLATARRDEAKTALERLTVASPLDATVLNVNVRAGEYAPAGPQAPTLVALGSLTPLHLRVEIDELDAFRFTPNAKAVAMLRGVVKREFPLRFVRIVPQVQPKRTVTGEMGERMDTRVMQVIYAIGDPADGKPMGLWPGQALDVFIDQSSAQ
ncbi:MAG: biotin/lipoyl-binding protein [Phycisphaerales bacterium]